MHCSWLDTYHIGGALDGVLGCAGVDQRVEIKNPNADRGTPSSLALTPDEQDTFDEWKGRPPVVVTSIKDAVDLVNRIRKGK